MGTWLFSVHKKGFMRSCCHHVVPCVFSNSHLLCFFFTMIVKPVQNSALIITITVSLTSHMTTDVLTFNSWNQPPCPSAGQCLNNLLPVALRHFYTIKLYLLQSPVTIADGVDSSPIEYIFSYNGSPISVPTGSTVQCTNSSCQHTFRVTSSQVQQYRVSVAARNVVGVGSASTPVTVGM